MKLFIVAALFVAAAVAAPASPEAAAEVKTYTFDNIGVEGYQYNVETSNGIKQNAEGVLKNVGTDQAAVVVRGQYSYTGPDGVFYQVTYEADEDGFHPTGEHIPKAL